MKNKNTYIILVLVLFVAGYFFMKPKAMPSINSAPSQKPTSTATPVISEDILQIIPTLTTPMVWSKPVSGTLFDLDGEEISGTIITAPTPSKQDNKLSPLLESNSILTTEYGWSNMQGADGMGEQIVTYEKESKKLIIWRKNNQYQILLSK
jgi:hypothetical protein